MSYSSTIPGADQAAWRDQDPAALVTLAREAATRRIEAMWGGWEQNPYRAFLPLPEDAEALRTAIGGAQCRMKDQDLRVKDGSHDTDLTGAEARLHTAWMLLANAHWAGRDDAPAAILAAFSSLRGYLRELQQQTPGDKPGAPLGATSAE